ncbi:hypothetical protein SARC_11943, partial [Sphaeroforma arctica JP610]
MFSYLKSLIVGSEDDMWPTGSFWRISEDGIPKSVFVDAMIKCTEMPEHLGIYQITVTAFASSVDRTNVDDAGDSSDSSSVYTFPIKVAMCLQEEVRAEGDFVSWYSLQRRGEKYAFRFDDNNSKPTTINFFK